MINIQELQTREDFLNLKTGDRIIFKYIKGQMYLLEVDRIEDDILIGKPIPKGIQETFVNISVLINKGLHRYIDSVVKLT